MLHNLALKHLGPSQIFEVSKKPSGRPVVRLSDKTLMASISHSRNVVCVALACDEQIVVGIDVEFHGPNRNVVEILRSLEWPDVGLSDGEFYQEWCLYEARFKATGIVARNEQPEMCVSALDVPAQYTGILVWTAECYDTSNS
jgi:4'-phosphopantetheinyl transferase